MVKWIVLHVPAWLAGLLLLAGVTGAAVAGQRLLRRWLPWLSEGRHNDVAGFLVAVIGVVYAVIVGFAIIGLWEDHAEADQTVGREAALVADVAQGSAVFGTETSRRIRAQVIAYGEAVIASWPALGENRPTARTQAALDDLFTTFGGLTPRTAAQHAFVEDSLDRLHEVSQSRRIRFYESASGTLPGVMWAAVLVASLLALGFCLLFGLENARLHYVMVAGVAMFVALNLWLLIELSYPFSGDLGVQPEGFHAIVRDLVQGV